MLHVGACFKSIKCAQLYSKPYPTDYHHTYDTVTILVETTNYVFCTPKYLLMYIWEIINHDCCLKRMPKVQSLKLMAATLWTVQLCSYLVRVSFSGGGGRGEPSPQKCCRIMTSSH